MNSDDFKMSQLMLQLSPKMDSSTSTQINSMAQELNDEQRVVFKECISANKSVFCTGRGGTGKSRVIESVIRHFRRSGIEASIQVAVTASTGIAAFQIRGMTLHRFAGVGILEDDKEAMFKLASRGASAHYWRSTDILIIDEISMISGTFFNNLSYVAQKIRRSDLPFGGMRLLIFGDFLQLPPVSRSIRTLKVFQSDAWKQLNPIVYELNLIVRQKDTLFTEMVSKIRVGECDENVAKYFGSMSRDVRYDDSVEAVRLYSLRRTTDEYNMSRLSLLTSSTKTYDSIDTGDTRILAQCPAPKNLHLKYGCQVMLIRNINSQAVNGSIGTVMGFRYASEDRSFQPLVKFVNGTDNSFTMLVQKCRWETVAPNGLIISSRTQIPLTLSWATTIHKSQGQTIPRLYVDLEGVFEYAQAYVALSRCINPSSLQIVNFSQDLVKADPDCVAYYNDLHDNVLQSDATNVANTTEIVDNESFAQWDKPTADTQIMLGNLSIQETLESSQQDSETS